MSLVLALRFPVLGLERVCPREFGPWLRNFLCPWLWPRALCPVLHLWYKGTASASTLAIHIERQKLK